MQKFLTLILCVLCIAILVFGLWVVQKIYHQKDFFSLLKQNLPILIAKLNNQPTIQDSKIILSKEEESYNDKLAQESLIIYFDKIPLFLNLKSKTTTFNLPALRHNPIITFDSHLQVFINHQPIKSHQRLELPYLSADLVLQIDITDGKYTRRFFLNTLHQDFPKYNTAGKLQTLNSESYLYGNTFNFIFKMDKYGNILYYRKATNDAIYLFEPLKIKEKIYYKVLESSKNKFFEIHSIFHLLDENFNPLQTIEKLGPYHIDDHEVLVLGLNHYIFISYHPEYIKNTLVNAIKVIEYHYGKITILFDSIDAIDIEEFTPLPKPANTPLDYLHANSLQLIGKTNLLISFPKINTIINFNYKEKKIDWILGGKKDMFHLPIEQQFYFQHFVRLEHHQLSLFDNHLISNTDPQNQHFAKGKIFTLDLDNKTVLEYKSISHPLHYNHYYCGSFVRNFIQNQEIYEISWGCDFLKNSANQTSSYTQMTSQKILYELFFDSPNGSYRILRFDY